MTRIIPGLKGTILGSMMYQYFIVGVPTEVESLASASSAVQTWQYSVRNQSRVIGHHLGSHGIPGIYFKSVSLGSPFLYLVD